MKAKLLICALALLCSACSEPSPTESTPSAAVVLVQVRQGDLPRMVRAYGTAEPALDDSLDMSLPFEGHVAHWAVTPGSAVKRGQLLLRFVLSPAAQSTWQQAGSALELAREQRDSTQKLLGQQLATREQLAQADKALKDAQATFDALPHPQGPNVDVTSPFDGRVASIDTSTGANVAPGTRLLSLVQSSGLIVRAGAERADADRLQAGESVELTPLDGGAAQPGQLLRVSQALNASTRLVDIDIRPEHPPMAGESFRADIHAGDWHGWLVPRDAVLGEGPDRHVFQVEHGKAHEVIVAVIGENGDTSAIKGPIQADLPVVTTGAAQLDDGMLVRALPRADTP